MLPAPAAFPQEGEGILLAIGVLEPEPYTIQLAGLISMSQVVIRTRQNTRNSVPDWEH